MSIVRSAIPLLFVLGVLSQQAHACNFEEKSLLGDWASVSKNAEQEEIAFIRGGKRNTFNSWADHRPYISEARWAVVGCVVKVWASGQSAPLLELEVKRVNANQLEFSEVGEKNNFRYRRVHPVP
jgi:ABC-type uncharacterized transport system YnjBCD substrate-binding protein